MNGAAFTTLMGDDWARSLPAARTRQRPAARRARMFAGPACPVCGRAGLHRELTGGTEIVHGAGEQCWWPAGTQRHERAVAEGMAA